MNFELVSCIMRYLLLILTFCLYGCQLESFKRLPSWWNYKEETIGEIVDVAYWNPTWCRYIFEVDGEQYSGSETFGNDNLAVGSKYFIAYNPFNPKQNFFCYAKPVFLEDEEVGYTKGVVFKNIRMIYYHPWYNSKIIDLRFSFNVGLENYTVDNYIINDKDYSREDIEGKTFRVKYWKENPNRALILLDEPIIYETIDIEFDPTDLDSINFELPELPLILGGESR
jgi:hypothetical protein